MLWECLSSPGVMIERFVYLGSENTSPVRPVESISSPYPTSGSSPVSGNVNRSTVLFGAQGCWRVQRSSTKIHICYLSFCSTLTSMLLKFNLIYNLMVNISYYTLNIFFIQSFQLSYCWFLFPMIFTCWIKIWCINNQYTRLNRIRLLMINLISSLINYISLKMNFY